MNNLSSTDILIIMILVGIIAVLIVAVFVLDYINKKKNEEQELDVQHNLDILKINEEEKNKEEVLEVPKEDASIGVEAMSPEEKPVEVVNEKKEEVVSNPSSNKVEEIKYVELDEEQERTQAKIELEELKVELARQEEEKRKLEEMREAKYNEEENHQEVVVEEIKPEIVKEEVVNEVKPEVVAHEENVIPKEEKVEVSEIASAINEELVKEKDNIVKMNAVQEDLNEILEMGIDEKIAEHENDQEEKAIISVEEFNRISNEMYDNNEVVQMSYEDEGNEPISLKELENLRRSEVQTVKLDDMNTIKEKIVIPEDSVKRLEDLPPIAMEKKFKSSPFISPVFGISDTRERLELEQTANYDKLNEEIKKTNEFLKVLKELQKNLE